MSSYQELQATGKYLSTKDVAKVLKQYLNKEFPSCKFSVTSEYYSGGSSLHIHLIHSQSNVIKRFEDISEVALMQKESNRYSIEDIKNLQNKRYHQLNHFQVQQEYKPNEWCNGVFLTEEGHLIFNKIITFLDQYHYDNSDSMTDYSDTNFYIHLNIGKWDKDYTYN